MISSLRVKESTSSVCDDLCIMELYYMLYIVGIYVMFFLCLLLLISFIVDIFCYFDLIIVIVIYSCIYSATSTASSLARHGGAGWRAGAAQGAAALRAHRVEAPRRDAGGEAAGEGGLPHGAP